MRILTLAASIVFVAIGCLSAAAATVTSSLNLVPASATQNQLLIQLLVNDVPMGAPATSNLSGTIDLTLELDGSNAVTAFRMTGGTFAGTDWSIALGPGLAIDATGTGGTFNTPGAMPSAVTGTGYDAAESDIIINQGIVTAPGVMFDLSQPGGDLTAAGAGTGALVLTPTVDPLLYDVQIDFPLNFISAIDANNALMITGTVVGQGVVAVPEASSFLMLSAVVGGGGLLQLRRRRQRPITAG